MCIYWLSTWTSSIHCIYLNWSIFCSIFYFFSLIFHKFSNNAKFSNLPFEHWSKTFFFHHFSFFNDKKNCCMRLRRAQNVCFPCSGSLLICWFCSCIVLDLFSMACGEKCGGRVKTSQSERGWTINNCCLLYLLDLWPHSFS